jgi:PST family polysaccharide transporter
MLTLKRFSERFANPDVTRAFANIVWLGLERLTQIAVAILISGMLARYFGPDTFGKWQYANTLLLVLSPITWVCGAEILVPTIVNRPPAQLGTVLGSAFALRISVSAAALLSRGSALPQASPIRSSAPCWPGWQ